MLIPALVEQLGEAYVAFGETPGQDAIRSIGARCSRVFAVQLEDLFRFVREVCDLWNRALHAPGEFILVVCREDERIVVVILEAMQFEQGIEHPATHRSRQAIRILQE